MSTHFASLFRESSIVKKKKMERGYALHLWITKRLENQLKRRAAKENLTLAAYVRIALDRGVAA
jgi:hypothetical protein